MAKELVGKFTFKVPEDSGHADAGKTFERPFTYVEVENDAEASKVMADKKLSLVEMVNDLLKKNARSNAYQSAILVYRPSEVAPEDIAERMKRDAIRLGMPEEQAAAFVASVLAAKANAAQPAS